MECSNIGVVEDKIEPAKAAILPTRERQQPYPVDTSQPLEGLITRYKATAKPIHVSIRDLVSWIRVGERSTHYLHPYPAKLLPHIAHFFLGSEIVAPQGGIVLDPFAGSGTVPLEVVLSGRRALYADANPLGILITQAKTQQLSENELDEIVPIMRKALCFENANDSVDVVNLEMWFSGEVQLALKKIRSAVYSVQNIDIRQFLLVTFSATVRKVSNADLRFPVPVRKKSIVDLCQADVLNVFISQLESNRARLRQFDLSSFSAAQFVGTDARRLYAPEGGRRLPDASVDLIMTSPPYAGAQKYVRATSLCLGWLGLVASNRLRELEDRTIGREHYAKRAVGSLYRTGVSDADSLIQEINKTNPLRAKIVSTYLIELRAALEECTRVLKRGGYFIVVIGDNTVCGHQFKSSEYICTLLNQLGLVAILKLVDPIRSRGLMTRRAASAGIIAHESVIVARKPDVPL